VAAVVGIIAAVRMRPPAEKRELREYWRQHRDSFPGRPERLEAFLEPARDEGRLELLVRLSAREDTGRQIDAEGSLGLSGYVSVRDVEKGVDQMLGRDPALHRPPRLAWGQLIGALAAAGIVISEQELIELPLSIELDDEVAARLTSAGAG
jgi:hypothetical protein